jgi:hypothetical protein
MSVPGATSFSGEYTARPFSAAASYSVRRSDSYLAMVVVIWSGSTTIRSQSRM